MENDTRDVLLYARLVDLHHRKTEAKLMGDDTKTLETLIELYEMELAAIEEARSKKPDDSKTEAASRLGSRALITLA